MLNRSILRMKMLIADTARFRSLVGVTDREAAMLKVLTPYADDVDIPEHRMPRSIISFSSNSHQQDGIANKAYTNRSSVDVTFEFLVPASVTDGEAVAQHGELRQDWFLEQTETIRTEMLALAGTGVSEPGVTHLDIRTSQLISGPYDHPEEELAVYSETVNPDELCAYWAIYQFEWR